MADYLGVPLPTYRNWRDGHREPPAAVNRLLDVLGIVEALAPAIHEQILKR
jgi:DNA-binding transcriptional regulator YiaG